MRMCVGCREMKAKQELVRVVRPQEGGVRVDRTGKAPGRGAYICVDAQCLHKARKTRALERGLECKLEDAVFEQLELELMRREG